MKWFKEKKSIVLFGIAILAAGFIIFFNQKPEQDLASSLASGPVPDLTEVSIEEPTAPIEESSSIFMVDIKGAVQQPGVYEVLEGERIIDVIGKAGGLAEKADQAKVNLSKKVTDEMVIYVPKVGEEIPENINNEITINTTSHNNESTKININKADSSQLETLTGIGPQKAAAIIDYRNKNGPFQKLEDLLNISGIGEKTFEKFKDQISIQ